MKKRKKKIYAVVLAVSAVTIIYFGFVLFFTKHYFFNTIINGENYSAISLNNVQNRILDTSSDYVLEISGRDQLTDTITSADIALRMEAGCIYGYYWGAECLQMAGFDISKIRVYRGHLGYIFKGGA